MDESEENSGRIEAGMDREKRGKGSTDAHEAGSRPEAPAEDGGLSETEKIGRSLDEVSDIIHDVLYESKESDAGTGGGGGAGADVVQRPGYVKAEADRRQAEADRRQADEGADPERRPDGAAPDGAAEKVGEGGAAPDGAAEKVGEGGAAPDGAAEKVGEGKSEAGRRHSEGPGAGTAAEKAGEVAGGPNAEAGGEDRIPSPVIESILGPSEADEYGGGGGSGQGGRTYSYDDFVDERVLISRDAFGRKEMKIKVLEVSDEKAPTSWKLGDRVKVDKILVTVKHLETQQIEEGEFDIESIEKEIARDRHYSSTNRWVPTTDIKNGYVAGSRHTSLISDAVALEYIIF